MKKFISIFALSLVVSAGAAYADTASEVLVQNVMIQHAMMEAPLNLINWKVGDSADYNVSLGFLGNGTMHEEATKDEGNTVWLSQVMDLMGQKQDVEMQLDRATAKVLKVTVNGQDQQIPDDTPEIISQDYTTVTVPAGTFKVLHVVAKSKETSHMEIWANPKDIVLEGAAKMSQDAQMGLTVEMELTAQKRAP